MHSLLQRLLARFILYLAVALTTTLTLVTTRTLAQNLPGAGSADVLTGYTRLACEALLCLSSGTRPSECSPALSRYFGIHKRKLSDTISARLDFLNLCPASAMNGQMQSLVRAISRGAGRCDPESLNRDLGRWGNTDQYPLQISNQLPRYCSVYTSHEFTYFDGTLPRYVGTPQEGGYWVAEKDYERERAKYEAALAERRANEERERNGRGNGTGFGYQGD